MALSATINISQAPSIASSEVIQDLTYTAQAAGAAGDNITITYVDPMDTDQSLIISVVGTDISASLATDSGGIITSTATEIKAAIDGDTDAHALVAVSISGTGSTVQTAQPQTPLEDGFDTAVRASQNLPIKMQLAISNSGGSPVTIDSIYPRVSSPSPDPAVAFSDPILPQPISVGAGSTVYVPFNFIIFGTESGDYVISCDICSTASQLLATPSVSATVTL